MSYLRTIGLTTFAVFALASVLVGLDLAIAFVMATTSRMFAIPWLEQAAVLWLILMFWVLPKDWMAINRPYSCRGHVVIDAPIAQVWDAVRVTPRGATYRSVVTRITGDAARPDRFYFHLDPRLSARNDPAHARIAVDVTQSEPERYLRIEYPERDDLPGASRDLVCSEVFLQQTDDGVAVTIVESLRRISITTIFTLIFLNPCKDSARRLQSWIEGSDDASTIGRYMQGVGPNGEIATSVRLNVILATVTAVVVGSVIALGIGSFVWHMIPES